MSLRRNHDHWSTMGNPLLLEETPMHVSLQTPCTYNWRPHDRIIAADPHGSIIGDPLILVGDP